MWQDPTYVGWQGNSLGLSGNGRAVNVNTDYHFLLNLLIINIKILYLPDKVFSRHTCFLSQLTAGFT